jgi:hypothetical protein
MILDKYTVADVSKTRSFFSFIFEQSNLQNNIKSVSSNIHPIRCNVTQFIFYLETALHVSGGTPTPNQERMQLYLQHLVFVTPLLPTVASVPDDGWRYYPKHVEHFPDKINCVTLHLVGYILEYSYDARTHER